MSSTEQPAQTQPTQHVTRAADWRVIYANVIGLGFGPGEARLNIGFDLNPAAAGTEVLEQAAVVMSHTAAKMLVYTLGAVISHYESVNGPIPVPADKIQEIDRQIKAQASSTPTKPT